MSEHDLELLSQYIDAELSGEQVQDVRARLLAEPALRAQYERLRAANQRLVGAFDTPGSAVAPAHVVQMVMDAETHTSSRFSKMRAGWGLAAAASVIAVAGLLMSSEGARQPLSDQAQMAQLDAHLAPVLERAQSGAANWTSVDATTKVRTLLSFPRIGGGWCREYLVLHGDNKSRGVACRSVDQWKTVAIVAESGHEGSGDYRPAGSSQAKRIQTFIDNQAADIAVSREQEKALINSGWQ